MTNTLSISISDTSGGNVSETKGATTGTAPNSGYTFNGAEKVRIGLTRGVAAEELKTYTSDNSGALSIIPLTDQFSWESTSDAVSIRAWSLGCASEPPAPATTAPNTGKIPFMIDLDQASTAYEKDLLYAPTASYTYAANYAGISLTLYHQLCRVVINVRRDNNSDAYTLSGGVPVVTIGDGSTATIPQSAYLTVPTLPATAGTWDQLSSETDAVVPKHWATPTTGFEHTYSAVLIPGDYGSRSFICVSTATGTFAYVPVSLTLAAGKQYTFDIDVRNQALQVSTSISDWGTTVAESRQANLPIDIRRNPLWYVAEYNMTNLHNVTWLTMGSADDEGYFYDFNSAMSLFSTGNAAGESDYYRGNKHVVGTPEGSTWHLPVHGELLSILPHRTDNIWTLDGYIQTGETVVFGCNSETQSGITDVSWWKKASDTEMNAIRYIGTPYCSAWKYEISGDLLTISSTLIKTPVAADGDGTAASAWYAANYGGVTWGNNDAEGAAERKFMARGNRTEGNGPTMTGSAHYAYYWSSTVNSENAAQSWILWFNGANARTAPHSNSPSGRNVRLFRDSEATPMPSRAITTVEQILAGVGAAFQVGDVVCQDGSVFRYDAVAGTARAQAEAEGRMPLGIIVYKCAASPTGADYHVTEGMGHALVMALDDIDGTGAKWSGSTEATGYTDETNALFPNYSSVEASANDFKGLAKTNMLANHICNASHEHPAFEQILSFRTQYPLAFSATGWFVASSGQWIAALAALSGYTATFGWENSSTRLATLRNILVTQAGGSFNDGQYFYSSSDYGTASTAYAATGFRTSSTQGIWLGGLYKIYAYSVRPFFAF